MQDKAVQVTAHRSIASLDGFRSLSIVLVLLGHLYGTAHYPQNRWTLALSQFAHLGVQIFFVISGYLITTLLLKEQNSTGRISLSRFYLRRTLRIFPAAFVYITVMALVAHPGYLAYAYTYTMCYAGQDRPWILGHLWSLSVEEQFYLLWPALLLFAAARRRQAAIAVILLAILARLLFWVNGLRDIDEYFPAVADNLMFGCLLAMTQDTLRRRCAWLLRTDVFVGLLALMLFSPHLLPRVRLEIFVGGIVPLIITLCLFSAVQRADWVFNNAATRTLGVWSYSLYLWQQPFLNHHRHDWWTTFPVNLVLAAGCTVISYYAVERPFLRLFRSTSKASIPPLRPWHTQRAAPPAKALRVERSY